jgi:predicted nucleic acid-binding protein
MNFLLDTSLVSEWVKPRPNSGVVQWLGGVDEDRVYLSVITLAEIRHGIERMALGARRSRLDSWLKTELLLRFEGRIFSVDTEIADAWGEIMAHTQSQGRPMGAMDAFFAATAQIHKLTLVTHNVSDFQSTAVHLLDPWT